MNGFMKLKATTINSIPNPAKIYLLSKMIKLKYATPIHPLYSIDLFIQ